MSKDTKSEQENYGYTLIYYEVLNRFKMDILEYLIIDTMIFKSQKNEYKEGIAYLKKKFSSSENTIKNRIQKLFEKGLIEEKNGRNYIINTDSKTRMKPEVESKWIVIHHNHRLKLNLSYKGYTLLYLFYSYFKSNRKVYRGYAQYQNSEIYNLSESTFYRHRKELKNNDLIYYSGYIHLLLKENILNWFENKNHQK